MKENTMANHGYAKTTTPIKPPEINKILNQLNQERWKNLISIEYAHNETKPDFEHVWILRYNGHDEGYWKKGTPIRQFWLASPQCLEMRHGGGGNWCWWIDFTILHEIATRNNGIITDDADDGVTKPDPQYYHEYEPFARMMVEHAPEHIKKHLLTYEMEITPTEFHFNLEQADI